MNGLTDVLFCILVLWPFDYDISLYSLCAGTDFHLVDHCLSLITSSTESKETKSLLLVSLLHDFFSFEWLLKLDSLW